MGGRGASGGRSTGGAGGGSSSLKRSSAGGGGAGKMDNTPFEIPKGLTRSTLKSFSRSQLENLATSIYANEAMKRGYSKAEGIGHARSMMSGNSTTALIKYISRRTK